MCECTSRTSLLGGIIKFPFACLHLFGFDYFYRSSCVLFEQGREEREGSKKNKKEQNQKILQQAAAYRKIFRLRRKHTGWQAAAGELLQRTWAN
ncbi:hypothetical protein CDAR_30681 [Caerostris darwini]|uniref:Uncharacterized protein n=1 Tax=Caerostris darwini TaxID=1538125 RepID=A0AAV4U4L5_9ARAC|nr:hypothetical protein CDAR_30681 [Caerostris darwini]